MATKTEYNKLSVIIAIIFLAMVVFIGFNDNPQNKEITTVGKVSIGIEAPAITGMATEPSEEIIIAEEENEKTT